MEKEKTYTRRQRLENWFYYNKLWVLVGVVILWVVGSMLWNVLGIGRTEPDFRILYVGSRQLPEDCVQALEQALKRLEGQQQYAVSQRARLGKLYGMLGVTAGIFLVILLI